MSAQDRYSELLISDTNIPDIFIARYMPMLGKDAISIYLWTRMAFKGEAFTLKDVTSYGVIPEEDIKTALAELVTAGVLVRSDKTKFEPVDLKKLEIDDYIQHRTTEDGTPLLKSDEKRRNLLAESINKTFYAGSMAYAFYKLIDQCLYDYHFDDQVVYALFEEGQDTRVHFIVTKMNELASRWNAKGYSTVESLKSYYELRDRRNGVLKCVKKMLHKSLNEMDFERINRWVELYGADEKIVEYAIRSLEWKGTIRPLDIENKLKEWFDAGVMSIDKAMVYESERHAENKTKSSRKRGTTNVRKTGKELGIVVEESPEPGADAADEGKASQPVHDSILDMFAENDDEDDN